MARILVVGTVYGIVRFPEQPEHQGVGGLIGGEDVTCRRTTFRSPGEAMTWCRKVLDGRLAARWEPLGPLVLPHTDPEWHEARVAYEGLEEGDVEPGQATAWLTSAGSRDWRDAVPGPYGWVPGDVARTDPEED